MKPDSLKVCLFKDVPLRKGRNEIEVRANDSKKQLIDRCTWILQ
jgi:beta-galactosidase